MFDRIGGEKSSSSGNSGNDPCKNRNVAGYKDTNTGGNVICINDRSSYPFAHSNSKGEKEVIKEVKQLTIVVFALPSMLPLRLVHLKVLWK